MSPAITTPADCALPPAELYGSIAGESVAFVFQVGPVDPIGAPGPRIDISPVSSLVVTNTKAVTMRLLVAFGLRMLPFCEGDCQPDLKHEIDVDGAGFLAANQLLPGMSGAHATDPLLGGNGTANPLGINVLRSMGTDDIVTGSGGAFGLPLLAPGASITLDHKLTLSYVGSWNATRLSFIRALVTVLGVPA